MRDNDLCLDLKAWPGGRPVLLSLAGAADATAVLELARRLAVLSPERSAMPPP